MAVLYISEYAELANVKYGPVVQVGAEPREASQTVAIGASSAQSNQFSESTRIVMLHTDAACHIRFGTNPTATTDDMRLPADTTVFFGRKDGSDGDNLKVAVITA